MAGYSYSPETGSYTTSIDIKSMYVVPISTTSAEVRISKAGMTEEPTSYTISYVKLNEDKTVNGSPTSLSFNVNDPADDPTFTISGLTANTLYMFTVVAKKGTTTGKGLSDTIRMNETKFNGKVIGGLVASDKISAGKGFLTITGPKIKNQFAIASKEFSAITLPSSSSVPIYSAFWSISEYNKSYATRYYSFGTSIFFDSNINSPRQGAGIGFFTNTEGTKGYFLIIESTALSGSQDRKTIRLVKTDGTKVFNLKDSQRSTTSTFEGVYGGAQYNIDIKVKISNVRVDITAYINGFKVTAVDETGYDSVKEQPNYIIGATKNVSLLASMGTAAFDYVYATDIDESQYSKSDYDINFYKGQFSNDLLNASFGDLIYVGNYDQDVYTKNKNSIEEFGTTAREIAKANVKFTSRPSFPLKWGTGNNNLVSLLSSKLSNFSGEAYVLNNTSTTVPLSDNNMASFYIYGNTLAPSGQLEYSTDEELTYTTKEPVIFESRWLQNLADVKALATWIKTNIVNKGTVAQITVFGNPLISVGDVVTINYNYHGFDGTEKFIVTNVNQSYQEGLTTSITCRLIVN